MLRRTVDHVFLPRKLSGLKQDELVLDEANLLTLLTNVIRQSHYSPIIPHKTQNLFQIWENIQSSHSPSSENISRALSRLGKDDMFGYYVRCQNAAFMISMDTATEAVISTFPVSLVSSTVMASLGEIVSAFPEQSIRIPYSDLLKSPALAHQLVTLTNTTLKPLETTVNDAIQDVPDTVYISEWFASVLSDKNSKLDEKFPTISKKVRDSIVGDLDKDLLPFRRSGMWMSLKVILHLSLLRSEVKPEDSIVIYKLILAEFVRRLCKAGEQENLEPDIGIHMMKKLARRVMKIKELPCSPDLQVYVKTMHTYVSATIKKWKTKMNIEWRAMIEAISTILPELAVDKHHVTHEKLPEVLKLDLSNTSDSTTVAPSSYPRHPAAKASVPRLKTLLEHHLATPEAIGNILFDVETWIFNRLQESGMDHAKLLTFAEDYLQYAPMHYKKSCDPIGASRMILAFLKIVREVDVIAVASYPLLLEHRAGVDITIFQQLLLPVKSQLELACELEEYFNNREKNAEFPSLLEENVITTLSFSVRYAEQNEEMVALRDKILADAEDTIKGKLGEVTEAKRDCEGLRSRILSLSCSNVYYGKARHTGACAKCYTTEILNEKQVQVYERPLRKEPENRLAVVFELLIPPEIASLREILRLLLSDICCAQKTELHIGKRFWTDYFQISQYFRGTQKHFKLGSTADTFLYSLHPDRPASEFIVENKYNCSFDGNFAKTWNVKNYCTLRIEPNSLYSVLEWTLKSTDHFQNQVLARQSECPEKLRLVEYKEFGSLRAGHRLQLRNILRTLVEKSISLKEEAVFTLICQAIWEAGPQKQHGGFSWFRDSHEDLVNPNFTEELVQELKRLLDTYTQNWAEPYTLMTTAVLVSRVIEFGLFTHESVTLLLKCRDTAFDWIKRIEEMITKAYESDSPAAHIQDLKMKLVDASICLCWTYSVGNKDLDSVLKSDQDVFYWLHALTRIYNIITSFPATVLSQMKRNLIRHVQNIALNIEPKLVNFAGRGLDMFVKENWNEAEHGTFGEWKSFPDSAKQVFHTTFQRDSGRRAHLQVDIIRGSFLINGVPVGYLPESITKNPTFSRTFKNLVFEIRPAMEPNTFITSHEFNNSFYMFTLLADGKTLLIRERHSETGDEFQLIPHTSFESIIPKLLVECHSHWLNMKKKWIDFRPISYDQFKNYKKTFRFHMETRIVEELSSGRQLFNVASASQSSISRFLSRLEHPNYILTFLDTKTQNVMIELPRMKLRFKFVEEDSTLENLEYNMKVRRNQNIDTLVGLESGILLENEFNETKFLMPHGTVHISSHYNPGAHQKIKVAIEVLRKPAIFTFDLDKRLQKIRAGKSATAWLYLAYLHALTASPLADPFTGLSGTESAFEILQSANCWSCKPYESEDAYLILGAISDLSPRRWYTPPPPPQLVCKEYVTWPAGLPVSCADDVFRLISDKLVNDSKRLETLFEPTTQLSKGIEKNELYLVHRAYCRYESLLSEERKICREHYNIPTPAVTFEVNGRSWITQPQNIKNTRQLAELGHSWRFARPRAAILIPFLVGSHASLNGFDESSTMELTNLSIIKLLKLDFRNNWINLYELGRRVLKSHFKSEWTLILSILAFRGEDVDQLLLLQAIAVYRVFFQTQNPSAVRQFADPAACFYDGAEVRGLFSSSRDRESLSQAQVLSSLLETLWPIDSCSVATFEELPRTRIHVGSVLSTLNSKLANWNRNRELNEFLRKVEATIVIPPDPVSLSYSPIPKANFTKISHAFSNKFLNKFSSMFQKAPIDEYAKKLYSSEIGLVSLSGVSTSSGSNLLPRLREEQRFYGKQVREMLKKVQDIFIFADTELLYESDLVRLTPTSLLRRLIDSAETNANVSIGALAVLWTLQQRVNRCILYHSMGRTGRVQLSREIENPGHENWIPSDHPEWLLFEVEMNLMIRSVQVDVARQMINPPDGKHSVMQLNMGEGKTAVIVPLLALTLGNGKQLCRVTVLKSLFSTNYASLVFNLGGLLNRRIYIFPCRRDMPISGPTVDTMLKLYDECRTKGGVVLTLPEYRLSFQLKGYEKCRAGEIGDASSLIKVQKWLSQNVRDILDESDEILHAKYQLIYTLGSQLPVDGGPLRWNVAQSLLKLIPARAVELQELYGDEFVHTKADASEPEIFHHTRLLKKECYQQLIDWLASDVLDGKSPGIKIPVLDEVNKELAHALLTNTAITKENHEAALNLFATPVLKETILILMGYLKYDILYLTLSKRWRVNYGVDKEGDRRMAIPFRAKDSPAKRTEFGHPDVAIMLTHLSYYYSGLSDEELEECFVRLEFIVNKEQEYVSWVNEIPSSRDVHPSIRSYSSINLTDFKQKYEYLFPALRWNRLVINFWLNQTVFPKESRAYEKKLVCTAWDLCPDSFKNPVTGFSGTNDSTVLLPLTISQQDLPALQDTNKNLRNTILLPENNNYKVLPRGTSGIDILRSLVQEGIPILLDSGALMLELSNERVAEEWLKLLLEHETNTCEAAVFFDDNHNLMVKDCYHLDESSPYDLSPYREKMDLCVVYLDDAHTRGTDLKIPPPSKACVTLCAGITRDKMVQACMRMRLLGKGHTISFYASDEAANAILTTSLANIDLQDVLNWIFEKNAVEEEDLNLNVQQLELPSQSQNIHVAAIPQTVASQDALKVEAIRQVPNEYITLTDGTTDEQILENLVTSNVKIFVDSAGLMSEFSNQEVAEKWFERCKDGDSELEAVVYLAEDHSLMLKPREGDAIPYSHKYTKKFKACLFYVNAVYARSGKCTISEAFEHEFGAVAAHISITLSASTTKADLDHSLSLLTPTKVSFISLILSEDAEDEIKSFVISNLGSKHVMDWVCENSQKFEQEGLVYWSGSGINYAHKQAVESIFKSDLDYKNLGERCCDPDFMTLTAMYGEHREDVLFTEVLKSHITQKKNQIERYPRSRSDLDRWWFLNFTTTTWEFQRLGDQIVDRCILKISRKRVLGQLLDEEHEKENEEEVEEEQEIVRPPPREPAIHILSPHVVTFVISGSSAKGVAMGDILKPSDALKRTSMFLDQDWCADTVLITQDFVNVIESENTESKEDEFLRTPHWIASFQSKASSCSCMLILSPFEANEIIPIVRAGKAVVDIRMFAPKLVPRQSNLINTSKLMLISSSEAEHPTNIPAQLLAPLYLFSGTLYFGDEEEHDAYCYFTGILPRPWTEAQEAAFNAGQIDNRGFVAERCRPTISPKHAKLCLFKNHPERLIRGIIEARHGYFPLTSHISKVVLDCRRVEEYEN